ncbi:hypothetical protein CPB85DRAFT_1480371 [Mucidula mucida]|nr:hypothetical protein CPB85DRAFT_1480371 [Mucidula mucida]
MPADTYHFDIAGIRACQHPARIAQRDFRQRRSVLSTHPCFYRAPVFVHCMGERALVREPFTESNNRVTFRVGQTMVPSIRVHTVRHASRPQSHPPVPLLRATKWHVPIIVGLIPVLMHSAVAIFSSGLLVYLLPLNQRIAIFIIAIFRRSLYGVYRQSSSSDSLPTVTHLYSDLEYDVPACTSYHF